MGASECPCDPGMNLRDLVLCLAPPEGEYETVINLSRETKIVVNRKGYFVRKIILDDFLPFVGTVNRPIGPDVLSRYGISDNRLKDILCKNIDNLEKAARSGSEYARRIIYDCNEVIEKIDC